jgi:hypothetical protein
MLSSAPIPPGSQRLLVFLDRLSIRLGAELELYYCPVSILGVWDLNSAGRQLVFAIFDLV